MGRCPGVPVEEEMEGAGRDLGSAPLRWPFRNMPHLGPGTLIEACYSPAKKLAHGLASSRTVNSSFMQSPSLGLHRRGAKVVLARPSGPCSAKAQVLGSTGVPPYPVILLKQSHLSFCLPEQRGTLSAPVGLCVTVSEVTS